MSKTIEKPTTGAVDLRRLVLPLDRDGRDDESPEGYPASNEDGTPAKLSKCGRYIMVNKEWHLIDGIRFHWQNRF